MGVFEKSQEMWQTLKKSQILLIYKIPYFPKPSNGKKLIKKPFKSEKNLKFS